MLIADLIAAKANAIRIKADHYRVTDQEVFAPLLAAFVAEVMATWNEVGEDFDGLKLPGIDLDNLQSISHDLLVYCEVSHEMYVASFDTTDQVWYRRGMGDVGAGLITHWQPLPTVPGKE
jgi:hypothetical protein